MRPPPNSESSSTLGAPFLDAVEVVLACDGHIAVSGAGTSETIADRLAHLLTVVGAMAFAISPGEALHGGAGAVTSRDVLIAISKGGGPGPPSSR